AGWWPEMLVLAAGLILFPLTTPLLYAVLAGQEARARLGHESRLRVQAIMAVVGLPIVVSALPHEVPSYWTVFALVAGALVDFARRVGRQARRARLSVGRAIRGSRLPIAWGGAA